MRSARPVSRAIIAIAVVLTVADRPDSLVAQSRPPLPRLPGSPPPAASAGTGPTETSIPPQAGVPVGAASNDPVVPGPAPNGPVSSGGASNEPVSSGPPSNSPVPNTGAPATAAPGTNPVRSRTWRDAAGREWSITRDRSFQIPFSVDPMAGEIVDVQLLVSADRGATWQTYARQRPGDGAFRFRANRDGEFAFASRTLDRNGRIRPEGPVEPQLSVVVDTAAPRLALSATVGPTGNVQARWDIQDEHLQPQSFRLICRTNIPGQEMPVATDALVPGPLPGTFRGQTTFWPPSGATQIQLQAVVSDAASNPASATKVLNLNRPGSRPNFGAGLFAGLGANSNAPALSGNPSGGLLPPTPRPAYSPDALYPPSAAPPGGLAPGGYPPSGYPAGSYPPAGVTPGGPLAAGRGLPNVPPSGSAADPPISSAYPPGATLPPNMPTQSPLGGNSTGAATGGVSPGGIGQGGIGAGGVGTIGGGPAGGGAGPAPGPRTEPLTGDLPGGERPRMTNSHRFSLDYDIESAGPGGVAEVELWLTRDRGATWTRWGVDADKQSPFEVQVDSDGIYGFRIVVISRSGVASTAPKAGDPADLWVGVDTAPPRVQLTSVSYGDGEHIGQLDIRWEAVDQRWGPRPVTLQYAESAGGPWNTIAAGLPNSGQYWWLVTGQVPKRVLLKIEVRDDADNAATFQTAQPISLEGLNPAGRIKEIRK